jgi:hypothetical protein
VYICTKDRKSIRFDAASVAESYELRLDLATLLKRLKRYEESKSVIQDALIGLEGNLLLIRSTGLFEKGSRFKAIGGRALR